MSAVSRLNHFVRVPLPNMHSGFQYLNCEIDSLNDLHPEIIVVASLLWSLAFNLNKTEKVVAISEFGDSLLSLLEHWLMS